MTAAHGWTEPPFSVASAAAQLAATEALWRRVAAGEAGPTLRWYAYAGTALVLGVGQAPVVVDAAACRRDDVQVVKRSSGGTVVLADPSLLALDVALPEGHRLGGRDVVAAYRWLGEAFAAALRELAPGHAAEIRVVSVEEARADQQSQRAAAAETAAAARALSCFGVLSPYEVALAGAGGAPMRKMVGLSQLRKRGVVLYQAGVYLRFAGEDLARYLALAAERRTPEFAGQQPGAHVAGAGRRQGQERSPAGSASAAGAPRAAGAADSHLAAALAADLDRRIASLADLGLGDAMVPALVERLNRRVSALE